MGEAGAAIRWNSVVCEGMTDFREQPTWTYYSQVSIASPYSRLSEREDVSVYAVSDSQSRQALQPASIAGSTSFGAPAYSSESSEETFREDNRQWGPWSLTQRELDVIQLLAEGATNSEMSERLFISPKTTKNHLAAIFQKLDVTNRTQALVRAVVMGLVSIE